MHHLHLRSCHALMLGMLSLGGALVACRPDSTAPTSRAEIPSAVVAAVTSVIPTAAPASVPVALPPVVDATAGSPSVTPPQAVATSTALTLTLPTLTPAAPTPTPDLPTPLPLDPTSTPAPPPAPSPASIRTADRLPADQPWLLIPSEQPRCGFSLIAVDQAGGWTRLNRGVIALGERAGSPPLLATCAADGTTAIVDPVQWTSVRIALDPGFVITQFVVSPDRKQAMLYVVGNQGNSATEALAAWIQITDLQTGAIRPFSAAQPIGEGPHTRLLGWGGNGVYYDVSYRVGTTLHVSDPYQRQISQELASTNLYVLDSAHDKIILSNGSTRLILSDVRQGTKQVIEQAAWLSMPVFAPDGTAIIYFRSSNVTLGVELVVFDIAHNTKAVLPHMRGTPFALMSSGFLMQAVMWSQDSRRIIIGTQAPEEAPQVALLTRDGTLLNTVPLPVSDVLGYSEVLGITNDDQLALDLHDTLNRHVVGWLPLRPDARPYAPNVMTGDNISSIILPPLSGGAPPIAPSSAAASTPLHAALVPITKLGAVSSDKQLHFELPMYDSVIYDVRGSLYSQALRGGPAVSLGDGSAVTLSPDRKTCISQRPDGLYRVPVGGGARVRLTPPLPDGTTSIVDTQVSPDGRQLVYGVTGPKPASWQNQLSEAAPWIVALYSAPIAGGTPVRLTPPLDPDSTLSIMMLSADSRHVIYTIDVPNPGLVTSPDQKTPLRTAALYSVPITGGTALRIAESTRMDDPIGNIRLSDDGQYLLYQYLSRIGNSLLSVPVAGGLPVGLDSAGGMGNAYQISADNRSVLYHNGLGIYVVPIAGGTVVNVTSSVELPDGGYGVQFTPDGTQVLFRTGRTLYRVPISGGPAISLSTYTSAVDTTHFDILVADRHVIYQDGSAIFSIPLAGGTPVPLTPPVDQDATLLMNQLSPDSRYVVYTIEDQAQHTRSIYSVPVGGGSPVTLLAGSIATTTLYTISGSYAIGMASRLLYAAPLADGPTSKLSVMPLIIEFSVISADGRHIIYLAHPPADISGSARALYVATLPAAQP